MKTTVCLAVVVLAALSLAPLSWGAPSALLLTLALAWWRAEDALFARRWARRVLGFAVVVSIAVLVLSRGGYLNAHFGHVLFPPLRLVTLFLLSSVLAREVDVESLLAFTGRMRFERLGLALSLALNVMPRLSEALRDVRMAALVRSRGRRLSLRSYAQLAEVMLAYTARLADDASIAAALRGHRALVRPRGIPRRLPLLCVVTGRRGAGKTPIITKAAEELEGRGLRVVGFVQEAILRGGKKKGFRVVDIASGADALLAERSGEDGAGLSSFRFSAGGFSLAARSLSLARTADVVVADEVGPMEMRGDGHWPALRKSLSRFRGRAIVVGVRPALVPFVVSHLGSGNAMVVRTGEEDDPVGEIVRIITSIRS